MGKGVKTSEPTLPRPPGTTIALLLWVGVTWTIFPSLFVGRLRDALSRAERKLFLHSWHFRQILGEGVDVPS